MLQLGSLPFTSRWQVEFLAPYPNTFQNEKDMLKIHKHTNITVKKNDTAGSFG